MIRQCVRCTHFSRQVVIRAGAFAYMFAVKQNLKLYLNCTFCILYVPKKV